VTGGDTNYDSIRWFVHSAHDFQIANVLDFLDPVDDFFSDVTYSSTLYFELWYDTDCINTLRDTSCFEVRILHNGLPMKLDTCLRNNSKRGDPSLRCTYSDFRQHITDRSFKGVPETGCKKEFKPPSHE